jgi:hypothetical protein
MFAGVFTSFLAMVIVLKAFVLHSLLYLGFGLILGNGINHLMVYYDAKDPKLDWESITVALKNSKATLFAMLISFAVAIPLFGGFIAISLIFSGTLLVIAFMVYWAVFYGIAVLLNFLFRKLLKNNIERLIAEKE